MSDSKDDKIDLDSDDLFARLESDFQSVIGELLGDESLEKFRKEYEKLHQCLKKSHESEKRLMSKCRELNAEIVSNSAKIATALKLSQDDKSTIQKLKQELDAAWKMVDTAHDKETRARETINSLKTEINELSKLVERGAGLSVGQENSVNQLIAERDSLKQQIETTSEELSKFRDKNELMREELKQAEDERNSAEDKVNEMQQDLQMRVNELQREMRKRDKLDREVSNLKRVSEDKNSEIEKFKKQISDQDTLTLSLTEQCKNLQQQFERTKKESEILNTRLTKIQQDFQNQVIRKGLGLF